MNRHLAVVLAQALTLATMAGCTIYPSAAPPRVMDLAAVSPMPQAERTRPLILRIETPYASDPLGSNRILAKPTPLEFRIYSEVRWRDTAPVVVRDHLVQRFRNARTFTSVITDTNPAEADWTLASELTAFHSEVRSGGVQVILELHAQLIDNKSREIQCAASFQAQEKAVGVTIERVVEAFGRAGETLSKELVTWAGECRRPKP